MNKLVNAPIKLDRPRSRWSIPYHHKTTCNVGDIVPFFMREVLPGDTVQLHTSNFARMQTPIHPVMDNCYQDIYYFFVPSRLVWKNWAKFMGESEEAWRSSDTPVQVPGILDAISPTDHWDEHSLANHFGLPARKFSGKVSALPFRAYVKIYNDWFRDTNLQNSAYCPDDDTDVAAYTNSAGDPILYAYRGGPMLKACKLPDVFTVALPEPQRGDAVPIPLSGLVPVYSKGEDVPFDDGELIPQKWRRGFVGDHPEDVFPGTYGASNDIDGYDELPEQGLQTTPINLWADLSGAEGFSLGTINQLRFAFQLQRLLETEAMGNRYQDLIYGHFGVRPLDSRLQRSEMITGYRTRVGMQQIVQNSATVEDSTPLGNVAGLSVTANNNDDGLYSSTEHGFIIGLTVFRCEHTYSQGIERTWRHLNKTDFYFPEFANIGYQPIHTDELYAGAPRDDVFGFQEAWYEYRYHFSQATGEMSPDAADSLDSWHYGDKYDSDPMLSSSWIIEDPSNLNRTLALDSNVADQFLLDFKVQETWTRVMPLYSVPGLIDHH